MDSENVAIQFSNPNVEHLRVHIESAAKRGLPYVERGKYEGEKGVVIAGLAPSLKTKRTMNVVRKRAQAGWKILAIKEAITYFLENDIPVHMSANMDPGAQEAQRVPVVPGVEYYIASSCHPDLFDHVISHGGNAIVYHSACGWPNEQIIYKGLFPNGNTMIGGFTVANRALGLCHYLGFKRPLLVGCDFGWRENSEYYADIVKASPLRDVFMNDKGRVDGKIWHTRPDLLASAVGIARQIKAKQADVIGDSLAKALSKKDNAFLDEVCGIKKEGADKPTPIM